MRQEAYTKMSTPTIGSMTVATKREEWCAVAVECVKWSGLTSSLGSFSVCRCVSFRAFGSASDQFVSRASALFAC